MDYHGFPHIFTSNSIDTWLPQGEKRRLVVSVSLRESTEELGDSWLDPSSHRVWKISFHMFPHVSTSNELFSGSMLIY